MAISEQLAEVLVHLPECPRPLAQLYLDKALKDVLAKVDLTPVWLDEIVISGDQQKYDLTLDQAGLTIKRIKKLMLNGETVDAYTYVDGELSLSSADGSGCLNSGDSLLIAVDVEVDGSGLIPESLAGADNLLVSWALWHLLRIQHQKWFNRELAFSFRQEYEREFTLLQQDITEQLADFLAEHVASGEDSLVQQILLQAPDCSESIAKLQLKKAVSDAMDKVDLSAVWLVPLVTQCGVRRYPLDFKQAGIRLQRVERVTLDQVEVYGFRRVGDDLILPDVPDDCQQLRVKVAVRADGSGLIPDALRSFEQGLVAWALWHLLLMAPQPWFQPQLANVFRQDYERNLLLFRAEAEEEKQADELQEQMAEMGSMPRMGNPMGFL